MSKHHPERYEVYNSPDSVLSFAIENATVKLTEQGVEAYQHYFIGLHDGESYARQCRLNHLVGWELTGMIQRASTVGEFIITTEAVTRWLPTCDNGERLRSYLYGGVPDPMRVPISSLRNALFGRVINSPWVNNLDMMQQIAMSLLPVIRPQATSAAATAFARTTNSVVINRLSQQEVSPASIGLFSALTDVGALPESIWGQVGMQNIYNMPALVVTEELHRRFVQERRDCYAPLSERQHFDVIAKYCFKLLEAVCGDDSRNSTNRSVISSRMRLVNRPEASLRLNSLIKLANDITGAANSAGGIPNEAGELVICDQLPEREPAAIAEALRRILYITRITDDQGQNEHSDYLHVEIVHELCSWGSPGHEVRRLLGGSSLGGDLS